MTLKKREFTPESGSVGTYAHAYTRPVASIFQGGVHISCKVIWYLSEKVLFWLFKIFEIQKGRTFSLNDILGLCTILVNIAIPIPA